MEQRPIDPILLIAQTCFPHLLSLDDLLAARCVCKAWRQSLSTAFCSTWRLPHSIWHTASCCPQLAATVAVAASACRKATTLLLDSGGTRPHLPPTTWPPLTKQLKPWLAAGSSPGVSRNLKLQLRNPPSPAQLQALGACLPCLRSLQFQHTHSGVYSRHLMSVAALTQLQELALLMEMPKLELRSLAHQRLRRVPLKADCLSSLVSLSRLEISCTAHTGDLLPDTLVTFSSPDVLAALRGLTHLSCSELALPGPWTVEQWLQPLHDLQSLQFVLQDDPALCTARAGVAAGSSSTCSAGNAAGAGAAAAGGAAGGPLLGTGSLSAALAAAAQAAGTSRADQQLAVAQQNLLAGLQNLSSALQQAANSGAFRTSGGGGGVGSSSGGGGHHHPPALHNQHHQHNHQHHSAAHQLSPAGPSASSSAGGGAAGALTAGAAGAGGASSSNLARTSSSTSTADGHDHHHHHAHAALPAGGAAGVAAPVVVASRPLLPISLNTCCPRLKSLVLANLYGERLIKMAIPASITRLVLHLANPSPGSVNGEQLAAVVLQAADSLLSLELGLGMRFSLSGAVMRGLKRSLKHLRDLTLIEGAQDHLEGLGCWCNLPRLTLVEGRCTVPLRGLYELSMRAAMGRTPGVLRYHGHARHVEELASRLGSALQELRLDSLTGLGSGYSRSSGAGGGGAAGGAGAGAGGLTSSGSGSISGSTPVSPKRSGGSGGGSGGQDARHGSDCDSVTGAEQESQPLPALAQLSCMTRLEVVGGHLGQLDIYGVLVLSNCKRLRVLTVQGTEPWLSAELGVKEQLEWLADLPQLRQLRLAGVMLGRAKLSAAGASSSSGPAAAAAGQVAGGRNGPVASNSSSGGGASGSTQQHSKSPAASGRGGSSGGGGGASSTACSSSSNSNNGVGASMPAVKGLGNGLGCGASATKGSSHSAPASAAPPQLNNNNNHGDKQDAASALSADSSLTAKQAAGAAGLMLSCAAAVPAAAPRPAAFAAAQRDESAALCLEELRRWLCEMLPNCRVWLD